MNTSGRKEEKKNNVSLITVVNNKTKNMETNNDERVHGLQRAMDKERQKSEKLQKENDSLNKRYAQTLQDIKSKSPKFLDKIIKEDNDRLREQIMKQEIEISALKSEVDRLRTSLSKVAGERMTAGNPLITDLSDPNRPQKLAEGFSSLYDNAWTDSHEIVSSKVKDEKKVCQELLNVFKSCWDFCRLVFDKQHPELLCSFSRVPDLGKETGQKLRNSNSEITRQDVMSDRKERTVKDFMRSFAPQFIPTLCRDFKESHEFNRSLEKYIDVSLELCWYSVLSDPPIDFNFQADNLSHFKGYTQNGNAIDFIVWPAIYLHKNGPLLCKGVVQFKSIKR